MDFKQFLEELGPIKVILTDIILLVAFAKCLLRLQEPECIEWDSCLFPLLLVLQTLQHPCPGLTSLLFCYYSSWERSSNVEGKIKQEIRGHFYAFICSDDSFETGLFPFSFGINASRRTETKLRLFLVLWEITLSLTLFCEVFQAVAVSVCST